MRDYTDYINSLENAGIRYKEEEWNEIIYLEAYNLEDAQTIKDISYIVDCLARDGFVSDRTVIY